MPKKTTSTALRNAYITVRMSDSLKALLSERASILGMSISTYALFLITRQVEDSLFQSPARRK